MGGGRLRGGGALGGVLLYRGARVGRHAVERGYAAGARPQRPAAAQLLPDSAFSTPSWASLGGLVRQLEASEVPAFGVAGPLDTGEPGVLTHPLVHRTHLDVFGYLFPPALTPPESFSWLSDVYGPRFTYVDSKYGGWKPGPLAARYPPSCHPRAEYLAQALDEAGPALRRWLAAQESAAAREALLELQELSPDGALL